MRGWQRSLLTRTRQTNPLLVLEASEGVVVVVVDKNKTKESPTHVWSERGVVAAGVDENEKKKPSAHICGKGGWLVSTRTKHKTPLLAFGAREGVTAVVVD